MPVGSTLHSFRLRPALAGVCAALLGPAFAYSDSIRVGGVTYENVYIGEGAQSYYIQNPADGSMITVPKSEVKDHDIEITPDRDERRKLRDQWRLKRMNRSEASPSTPANEAWREDIPAAVATPRPEAVVENVASPRRAPSLPPRAETVGKAAPTKPVVISSTSEVSGASTDAKPIRLSNVKDLGARYSGQKMFMDKDGVAMITNRPGEFEGRPDYVEVTIHYDPIEVPEAFRAPKAGPAQRTVLAGNSLDDIVTYYAKQHALDPALVYAVIRVESNGNPHAVSSAGARGLMQLMPGTARDMGVDDIFDPAENIAGGTQYLSKMFGLFNENIDLALAGYNAGPGNVKKYGGIPPFKETQNYVELVQRYHRQYKRSGMPRFDIAGLDMPVDRGYLPPESSEFYQIVLDNGLTVAADRVYEDGDRYIYWFRERSGHFPASQVISVREPTQS